MGNTTPDRGYEYPLYQDPTMDFPAAIETLAEDIDADVTALENFIEGAYQRPSIRINTAAGQSVPASTVTPVNWTGGGTDYAYDITPRFVASGGIALNSPGVYLISAYVTMTAPGSGGTFNCSLSLTSSKALTPLVVRSSIRAHATQDTWMTVSGLTYNDAVGVNNIGMEFWQTSGSARTIGFKQMSAVKVSNLAGGT